MKMALFGGSFDPIHNGHRYLAETFLRRLLLDRVILMPTFVPPHKLRAGMAPAEDRLAMCRLATKDCEALEVSDLEIRRGGASFTVDTLETLAAQYPQAQWYLIVGADMFLTLSTWYRFDRLRELAVFCTAPRDGVTAAALEAYAEGLRQQGARCIVENIPEMPVSSTEIRACLQRGGSAAIFLPRPVSRYIAEHHLYQSVSPEEYEEQLTEILRRRLSPQRFTHSLAVSKEAQRLACRYGADPDKARLAGLLHDIMKNTPPQTQLQMLREFGIILDDVERHAEKLWHAVSGAAFVERILGITDPEILSAIRYHTTAKAGMTPLEKVLYLADFTSDDRNYEDVDVMRRLVDKSENEALIYALRYTILDLAQHQVAVHPDTVAAYNEAVIRKQEAENDGKERA